MANRVKIGKTIVHVGDTVDVTQKIMEGEKKREQAFIGVVIAIKGSGSGKSFTVRRIASGNIGVERIWPLNCPSIARVRVKRRGRSRRAKLYYLRKKLGRRAVRVKERREPGEKAVIEGEKIDEKKKPGKPRRKSSLKTPSK